MDRCGAFTARSDDPLAADNQIRFAAGAAGNAAISCHAPLTREVLAEFSEQILRNPQPVTRR